VHLVLVYMLISDVFWQLQNLFSCMQIYV
jgi:hypothetical protein